MSVRCNAMQVTKQQLEASEIQIAELKALCEQHKVCVSMLHMNQLIVDRWFMSFRTAKQQIWA